MVILVICEGHNVVALTTWQKMKRKSSFNLLRANGYNDGMTGIVATCTSCADIHIRSKYIDELSFTLISPLRPKDDSH